MKKTIITLGILVVVFISVYSQQSNTVFAPIGAKWYYGIQVSQSAPDENYRTIESVKDTLIAEKYCSVLQITDYSPFNTFGTIKGTLFLYSENKKVYQWNKHLDNFQLLYDFAANAGDSWDIPCAGCSGNDTIKVTVTRTDSVEITGKKLKRLFYSNNGLFSFGTNDKNITEYIGGDGYMLLFGYAYDDMYIPYLRCYSDSNIHFQATNKVCDSFITTGVDAVKNEMGISVQIKDKHIYISSTLHDVSDIKMYDINGRILKTGIKEPKIIDLTPLCNGMYILKITLSNLTMCTFKILRQ